MTSFPRQLLPRNCRSQFSNAVRILFKVPCPNSVERVGHINTGALSPLVDFYVIVMVEEEEVEGRDSITPSEELVGGFQPIFVDLTLPFSVELLESLVTLLSHWWIRWRVPARLEETVLY